MTKPRLYIHIGTYKTGSTTLQIFLRKNRALLQNQGIIYPVSKGILFNHHRLAWALLTSDGDKQDHWPHDLETAEKEWEHLHVQMADCSAIISSEILLNLGPVSIGKIRDWTSAYDVKIVVYWRRRDLLENSWYNQRIKSGVLTNLPRCRPDFVSRIKLDRWAAVFGKDNIIVRPYERDQLFQGDVTVDFITHVLGLEPCDDYQFNAMKLNSSIHRIAVEYARMVNLIKPVRKIEDMGNALDEVTALLRARGKPDYPAFSPSQRLSLIKQYQNENASIATEYLGRNDGRLFCDPLPLPDEEWQPYNTLQEEDAILINSFLYQKFPSVLHEIARYIFRARHSRSAELRKAALCLMPGIEPDIYVDLLRKKLTKPPVSVKHHQCKDPLQEIYESNIWKMGKVLDVVSNQLPDLVRTRLLKIARRSYPE